MRWVTTHGFSVNVCPDMRYFDNIIPCGITDKKVGYVQQFEPYATLHQTTTNLIENLGKQFSVSLDVLEGEDAFRVLSSRLLT